MWKINNTPINNHRVNRQMKENIKKYFTTSGNVYNKKHNFPKSIRHSNRSYKRDIYYDPGLPRERKNIFSLQI